MTRRELLTAAAAIGVIPTVAEEPLIVPVRHVVDRLARLAPAQMEHFWSGIWPQAVEDFAACGIHLHGNRVDGEVHRPSGREPVIKGLDFGVLNLVITHQIPMEWDDGRALAGVTAMYRGRHLCMVALNYAHGHQIPFLSLNTCVHELLHAFLQDIFETRPRGLRGEGREFRVDWLATRLWLFHDGAAIRRSAEIYVERLRSGGTLEG